MAIASVTKTLKAPTDDLWRLVADFGDCSWMPAGTPVELEGEGEGMVRVMGGVIREKLEACDAGKRTLRYSIADEGAPFPCTGYLATMVVEDDGDGSRLTWSCEATPREGTSEAELSGTISGMYELMIGWISDKLASR